MWERGRLLLTDEQQARIIELYEQKGETS